ncbi:MAG: hypothetical protein U5K71_14850 [Gracilimonas sp.]|nr:hypothetical protein [Gracilimonas sp.]
MLQLNKAEASVVLYIVLAWAEKEIVLFLKSGSRTLSLHNIDDEILEHATKEIIFELN